MVLLFVVSCLCMSLSWSYSLLVTGDVNLNPSLATSNLSFVWGSMLPILQGADVLAINHESTLAGVALSNPNVIQFEDPLHYLGTYAAAGVDFVSQANNHQFDFGLKGVASTIAAMEKLGIAWGGLGDIEQVTRPRELNTPGGKIAFFTLVVDECWKNANGTLYLDGCTCGSNAGPPPAYQCYQAGNVPGGGPGLWYNFGITDYLISNVTSVVGKYQASNPDTFIVVFLHVGPNFQWQPYPEHEWLLRNISTVSNLVWGTSSHHIQRFEVFGSTPIIYGLGDFLFRHVVGVEDFCPLYAIPCESYRPDLSLAYQFEVVRDSKSGRPRIDLDRMRAYPTQHSLNQTALLQRPSDLNWIEQIFNELSGPSVTAIYNSDMGAFELHLQQ